LLFFHRRKALSIETIQDKYNRTFQFWQSGNQPIELWSDEAYYQKLDYIHRNPIATVL